MSKRIIDVVGLAGSGKSKVCEYICQTYGFELYRPSDALREYARAHGRSLNGRQDYVDVHHELIANDPMAIIQPVFDSGADRICLDGMRAPLPFLELREHYGAVLIYLDCPADVRLRRIQADTSRSGHRVAASLNSLLADEAPDMQNPNRHLPNMTEMRELADHVVDASQPLGDVLRRIDEIVTKIISK